MKFEQPELNYNYEDLEPFIDAKTMEVHYSKHHKAYTDKFNASAEKLEGTAEEIVANWNSAPDNVKMSIRNNGGGYLNHSLFFSILKKDTKFEGEVAEAIIEKFNSFENFKEKLELRLQNMEQIEIKEINEETGEAIVQVKEEVELFGFLKLKVRKEFRLNEDGEVKEKARWFNRFEKSLE